MMSPADDALLAQRGLSAEGRRTMARVLSSAWHAAVGAAAADGCLSGIGEKAGLVDPPRRYFAEYRRLRTENGLDPDGVWSGS